MPPVRRFTATLAADVSGYSRLMGADEEGTHERLKAHLSQLVNQKIKEHRGRIVKNTGDGMLAEFFSVVDAVRCAAEVQRGMADRNATGTRGSGAAAGARQLRGGNQLVRARAGTRSAVHRGEGLVGKCSRRPRVGSSPELILERFETRGYAGKPSSGGIPRQHSCHLAKGQLLRVEGRCDEAMPEFEMAIASNRNSSGALFALGECKLLTGSIDEAIPLEEEAVRLGPRDPYVFNRYLVIGKVHLLQSRIEEAIVWLERARIGNPGSPWPYIWLAAAYALKGETDRAAAELDEARRLLGEGSFPSIAQMRAHGYWGVPKIHTLSETTYFRGLRKAGVPEE
jgi:tetratricopeptide (TPR) repeat protein